MIDILTLQGIAKPIGKRIRKNNRVKINKLDYIKFKKTVQKRAIYIENKYIFTNILINIYIKWTNESKRKSSEFFFYILLYYLVISTFIYLLFISFYISSFILFFFYRLNFYGVTMLSHTLSRPISNVYFMFILNAYFIFFLFELTV